MPSYIKKTPSAVSYFLDRDSGLTNTQREFIMDLLKYAATHNYFWFGRKFYLHSKDVAMGANYAPNMANLFMAQWEEGAIGAQPRLEPFLWARYIDDILLLWKGASSF